MCVKNFRSQSREMSECPSFLSPTPHPTTGIIKQRSALFLLRGIWSCCLCVPWSPHKIQALSLHLNPNYSNVTAAPLLPCPFRSREKWKILECKKISLSNTPSSNMVYNYWHTFHSREPIKKKKHSIRCPYATWLDQSHYWPHSFWKPH